MKDIKDYIKGIGIEELYTAAVSDILEQAVSDKITKLSMTDDEYKVVRRYMIYSAQWNWDGKTFMGIEFVIKPNA